MKFFVVAPLGADIARAVNPTANAPIPGPPSDLEDAFVQGCRGASRRSVVRSEGIGAANAIVTHLLH